MREGHDRTSILGHCPLACRKKACAVQEGLGPRVVRLNEQSLATRVSSTPTVVPGPPRLLWFLLNEATSLSLLCRRKGSPDGESTARYLQALVYAYIVVAPVVTQPVVNNQNNLPFRKVSVLLEGALPVCNSEAAVEAPPLCCLDQGLLCISNSLN
ncbi:hypothetical protein E2C01_077908 [Portunus trituberculatus]|uniref:Uncharacterized protein n=1 Tax=Portunus trituberculatus TaxID=210409 RepID=A0A5B7INH3_PORTR|nr:hypothetical protein [Portunus trituberculatus]